MDSLATNQNVRGESSGSISSGQVIQPAAGEKRTRQNRSPGIIQYSLTIVQHPLKARMTGFGEKDRRPIDPPVIVSMTGIGENGEPVPVE